MRKEKAENMLFRRVEKRVSPDKRKKTDEIILTKKINIKFHPLRVAIGELIPRSNSLCLKETKNLQRLIFLIQKTLKKFRNNLSSNSKNSRNFASRPSIKTSKRFPILVKYKNFRIILPRLSQIYKISTRVFKKNSSMRLNHLLLLGKKDTSKHKDRLKL